MSKCPSQIEISNPIDEFPFANSNGGVYMSRVDPGLANLEDQLARLHSSMSSGSWVRQDLNLSSARIKLKPKLGLARARLRREPSKALSLDLMFLRLIYTRTFYDLNTNIAC